jgi:hypothetical protein
MERKNSNEQLSDASDAIKAALKSQYRASLAMLRESIEECPDEIWDREEEKNSFWQIAYHTLFFAHLYIQTDEEAFHPWEHHQGEVQYPDSIPGPPDPDSDLPLIAKPYTKEQMLAYAAYCEKMVDEAVDAMNVLSPESGFSWYKVSKLEHQIVNIRHIQHGAAQLADRLRAAKDVGIDWVGARKR